LDLDLYPNLNLDLNLDLIHQLFDTLYQQLFATLFGAMFDLKYVQSQVSFDPESYRQKLPPRQPVGRGVGGRIVVPAVPDRYI
jgi:hypothetical protein